MVKLVHTTKGSVYRPYEASDDLEYLKATWGALQEMRFITNEEYYRLPELPKSRIYGELSVNDDEALHIVNDMVAALAPESRIYREYGRFVPGGNYLAVIPGIEIVGSREFRIYTPLSGNDNLDELKQLYYQSLDQIRYITRDEYLRFPVTPVMPEEIGVK